MLQSHYTKLHHKAQNEKEILSGRGNNGTMD